MNKMKIFEAIDLIDDDLIKEAEISPDKTAKSMTAHSDESMTVSGVEVYRGIRWQRFAALASAIILIAGLGSVGVLLHKNRPPRQPEPSETIIPAATEDTAEAADQQSESTEAATKNTKKAVKAEEKETKESTNTAPTTKANEEEKPASVTSPADADEEPTVTENSTPEEKPTEPARTVPAPTTQKPIATAKTTTTAVKTTAPKVTEPEVIHFPMEEVPTDPPITWRSYECPEMFEILESIEYTPIPMSEYAVSDYEAPNTHLRASDGTVYALNFVHRWVMKYGNGSTDWGYAPMPDRLYELFCG